MSFKEKEKKEKCDFVFGTYLYCKLNIFRYTVGKMILAHSFT